MSTSLVSIDITALGQPPTKYFEALDAAGRRIAERTETSPTASEPSA